MKKKNQPAGKTWGFLRWPLYLSILLIVLHVPLYYISLRAGLWGSCGAFVFLLAALVVYLYYRPRVLSEMIRFSDQYESIQSQLAQELYIPYALLDRHGNMVWSNAEMTALTGKSTYYRKSVETIFPEITEKLLPSTAISPVSELRLSYQDRIYRARLSLMPVNADNERARTAEAGFSRTAHEMERAGTARETQGSETGLSGDRDPLLDAGDLIALYLYDETELIRYMQIHEDNKLVVALAYLDNYEEALQSVEEVRRSLLIALIDRKISKYFADYDGLVRKLEKDKYFLILKMSSLEELKEHRFHILEEVKTVNIGNEMAITLSIGFGVNGASFLQNYEYCRIAIEMALGRGGDQVVLKDGEEITYYGGKSQQVEKSTRVKARVKAQALKEFMSSKERVVVMGHRITDVDALGAAVGIYRAGKTLGKPVHIVVNDPSTSIRPLMAEFLNHPDYETNMFIDGQAARELVDHNTVVVVVDTNKPSYTECPELLSMTQTIVVLDHHRRGNEVIENAVLSYVEPYASSACEMVAEILQYFQDGLRIRGIEADCLYAGIVIDTNNFVTRSGVRTFEAAAFLRRNGADITRVRKLLRDNINSYKARAQAVSTAEIYKEYFAISRCTGTGLESPTVVGAQAANELLNISGVKASFVLTPYQNEIYVSARAIDEVNVQIMMEKMGGGGHINIAGAQLQVKSMEEAEQLLKSIIDEVYEEE